MKFRHLHSIKEVPYGLFTLHVQLDFTIGVEKINSPNKVLRVIEVIKSLNDDVSMELGTGFRIGYSYFVGEAYEVDADQRIEEVVEYEIIPQLYEYWFDDEGKADGWANRLRGACNVAQP